MESSRRGWNRLSARHGLGIVVLLVNALASGCAALTNPLVDGIPVRLLPQELLDKPKDQDLTIPLNLLGQDPPFSYRLGPGDVLGVWVEGVLGERTIAPPVSPATSVGARRLPPTMGYPVTVREDGTVKLPLIEAIPVQGLSVSQAEDAIRDAYTRKEILPAGRERVFVSLMHERQYHVIVVRQESSNVTLNPELGLGGGKRGTGYQVDLPASENDVLHALAQTGGLPGLDAYNEIVIFRSCFHGAGGGAMIEKKLEALPPGGPLPVIGLGTQVVKIPLRACPGDKLPFRPEDVILKTGDVVFLEARDQDVFYTGGLLPSGEYVLPRDRDLDVVEAISRVKGPLFNGAFNNNNLSGALIAPDIGSPSPCLLTVLRKTPCGQIPIRVDLQCAMHDRRERLIVRAGDMLILQERPGDAMTRYVTQTFFNFSLTWRFLNNKYFTGLTDFSAPSRIPNRITSGDVVSSQ